MRFTTHLIAPYQKRLCDDIMTNRPLTFSKDLVYFVTHKYQKNWRPFQYKTYTIHERSPLTHSIRKAVDLIVSKMDDVYEYNYNLLIAPCGEDRLVEFVMISRSLFDEFNKLETKSINVLFDIVIYVARLSVECEAHGVRDAPHMAIVMINLFLMNMEKDVFGLFHQQALDIIDIFSNEPPGEVPA